MDAPLPSNLIECWHDFLSAPRTLDDLFNHPVLFPLQRRREMEQMHSVCALNQKNISQKCIMEIGADKGGSVWAWLQAFPECERMIVCEIRGTPYSHLFEQAFPHVHFLWMPVSSYDASSVNVVRSWLSGSTIDVLFIDGDKGAFDKDFRAYRSLMSTKGIILMHDVCDHPMKEAYNNCRKGYNSHTIKDVTDYFDLVERGGLPTNSYEGWLKYWRDTSCTVGIIKL